MQKVMFGGLPLSSTLKRRGLGLGTCFFCTIQLEENIQVHIGGQHTSAYWIFWMLEHVGLISSSAYSGFLITLLDVHLPT